MKCATSRTRTIIIRLANHGTPGIWVVYTENHPAGTYQIFNPKTKKVILTQDVTFLQKSYSEYTQVEKPMVVTTSYEGSDKEEELEMVPIVNHNKNINIIRYSDSDSSEEDFKNSKDILTKVSTTKSKFLSKPLSMQKWFKL